MQSSSSMETIAQSSDPQSKATHHEPSREEILANILHVLSSSTEISPLLCGCQWDEEDEANNNNNNIFWDPFLSFVESTPNIDSGVASSTHSNFFHNWLIDCLQDLHRHQHVDMGGVTREDMIRIRCAFVDTSRMNKILSGDGKPDEDLMWQAGLGLMKTHLFLDEESGTRDDDDANNLESRSNLDPILPHELLRIVMDSYYCKDYDMKLGELSAIEVDMSSSEQAYRLPSSIAMLFLRTLLISRALESAEQSISNSSVSSKPVRWRRLKSMVDDALSLFQRMSFDFAGQSIDNFEYGRHPKTLKLYPVEPNHITTIATWLYTNHVFPSCHDLLLTILRNNAENSSRKGTPSGIKILETCYDLFRLLTSLLALEVAAIDKGYSGPSRCVQWVMNRIESQSTSDFFDRVISAQKEINSQDISSHGSILDDEEKDIYCPWKDSDFDGRGLSLEEDLLLYPSIRRRLDNSDNVSSATFFDELGIAMVAYWKLRAQTESSLPALNPLPSPYPGSYRWTLLFPHVITFLCGSSASSSMKKMDELKFMSTSEDGYLVGINFTTFSLGFHMLQTLITKAPAIRPMTRCTESQNPTVRWAHSSRGLESTIGVLLSHVLRISSLEASRRNHPPSESDIRLKYSSLEVMNMTRTLLSFYNPEIQIHTLSRVCRQIKTTPQKALLSTTLDFMRPIIMGMCKNIQQYNDEVVVVDDMAVMQSTSNILDDFLSDIYTTYDDSMSALPKYVDEFMEFIETYSSVFAIMRLQRLWILRCTVAVEEEMVGSQKALSRFDRIVKWMDSCLGKLQCFDSSTARLIDFWERSEDRPMNWHRLFLMKLALQDVLSQPNN